MPQVRVCAAGADLSRIQPVVAFRVVLTCSVHRSLRHSFSTVSGTINIVFAESGVLGASCPPS